MIIAFPLHCAPMIAMRFLALCCVAAMLAGCKPQAVQLPASAFTGEKVLRYTFQVAETGFDPVKISDYYSHTIISGIFYPLLTYDYLARPAKLVPNTAEALPQITPDGKTYTLRVKPGIFFTPDAVFKGKSRELTAEDYVYSIKRFLDPANRSPNAFMFAGKIVGLDELAAQASKAGRFDYDARVDGLAAPDRYTLRIQLKDTDFNFSHVLAFSLSGAVAREVIEAYGNDSNAHPVGTGPFFLKHYVRSSKMVLARNPAFREVRWQAEAGNDPADRQIVRRLQGKKLPLVDRVEYTVMDEAQSRWLSFLRKETDVEYQLEELAPKFLGADGRLKPEFTAQGIRMDHSVDPEIIYLFMNTQNEIGGKPNPLGGFTPEKIALRRAVAMAYNVEDQINVIRKGQAVRAHYPIPPGVAGHDPDARSSIAYDPRLANALLDKFGYRRGNDGYRMEPNGKPLVLQYFSAPSERDRQFDELMKRTMDGIGLKLDIRKERFSEIIKLSHQCRVMMKHGAWIADCPDGDNFMQLLYGPNIAQSNSACYQSRAYDERYEQSRRLPDGAERNKLYREMTRQMETDTAWLLTDSRYRNVLVHSHVVGFKKHPVMAHEWLYLDVDSTPKP